MRFNRFVSIAAVVAGGILTALSTNAALADKRIALVIGNSTYQTVPKLRNPVRDAEAISQMLKNVGFDVQTFENLGTQDFRRALRTFQKAADDADIAVVYYAGHGFQISDTNYLIPVDAVLASDRDAPDEAIPLDRIISSVETARKLRVIIIDACRDNPFDSSMARHQASRGVSRGLTRIDPDELTKDTLIAFAARAGAIADDGTGEHSPFTTALLKNLAVPGLDLRFAFGRVRDEVMKITGNKQEPYVNGSLGGENISLIPAPAQPAEPLAAKVTSDPGERTDYELVLQLGTLKAWEVFLNQHKTGFYAELAKEQIAKLNAAGQSSHAPAAAPNPTVAMLEAPPPQPAAKPTTDEALAWDKIKDTGDQAALQKFIKQYPNSPLALNAQHRLEVLQQAAQEREEKVRAEQLAAQKRADEAKQAAAAAAEAERQKAEQLAAQKRADEAKQAAAAAAAAAAAEAERQKAEQLAAQKRADEAKQAAAAAAAAAAERQKAEQLAAQKRADEAKQAAAAAAAAAAERQKAEQLAAQKRADEAKQAAAAEAERQKAEQLAAQKRADEAKQAAAAAAAAAAAERQKAEQLAAQKRADEAKQAAAAAAAAAAEAERQKAEQLAAQKRADEVKQAAAAAAAAEAERQKAEQLAAQKRADEAKQAAAAAAEAERQKAEQLAAQQRADEARRAEADAVAVAAAAAAEAERQKAEQLAAQQRADEVKRAQMAAAAAEAERQKAEQLVAQQKLIRTAQTELIRLGCFSGAADGTLNDATKAGISRYLSVQGRPAAPAVVTDDFISELNKQQSRVCPLDCPQGQTAQGATCVASVNPAKPVKASHEDNVPSSAHPRPAKQEAVRRPAPQVHEEASAAPRVSHSSGGGSAIGVGF